MTHERLTTLLHKLRAARIGVIGDFCLDAYWQLDTGEQERSLETGKATRAVRSQRYSLGGAGNVVSNLVDLGIRAVYGFSVVSDDLFGREMLAQLRANRVDTIGMVIQAVGWDTPVYAKPYLDEDEQERIDFGRWNRISAETERKLAAALRTIVPRLDALIVNQQLMRGIYSPAVVQAINALAREVPSTLFFLDSRNMSEQFTGMIAKLNTVEAARVCGAEVPERRQFRIEALRSFARNIVAKSGKPVFMTRGEAGILLYDGKTFQALPAVPATGPIDPVGAGDTTVSAIAASLAAGASHSEAAEIGILASSVTVRKLRQTGTATPAEILEIAQRQRFTDIPRHDTP